MDSEPYPPPQTTSEIYDYLNSEPYPLPEATLVEDSLKPENNLMIPLESSPEPYLILDTDPLQYDTFTYFIYLPAIFRPYDRGAAVAYADQFAHDRNSNYPNFGTGCDCNDCTNYVSQSLHEGGLPLKTGNWDPNSPFEWWYKPIL